MNSPETPQLLGLEPTQLRSVLAAHFEARGEPSYRTEQVVRWIAAGRARSFGEMTDLSAEVREGLDEAFSLAEAEIDTVAQSSDGTTKHLWRLHDDERIESVLIPSRDGDRITLCLSSQAGCAMKCSFCSTGWAGFRRHLTAAEIVAQYRASRRWLEDEGGGSITNLVFMGMGEPLANRDALHPALTILNELYGVGARRITVSTVGVVPGIIELAERPEQFRLALSLHAPTSELRKELIPLEKRWPLEEVIDALRAFAKKGGRRITFEYTMIDGLNDGLELVEPLAKIASEFDAFVNLIPFNPIPFVDFRATPFPKIREFSAGLEARGVASAVREPRGRDIDAACGQLRANALVALEGVSGPDQKSAPA